jgi:hypothetical protein
MSDHSVNLSNESPTTTSTYVGHETILDALSLANHDASPNYVPSLPSSHHKNKVPLPVPPAIFAQPAINLSDEGPWPPLSPGSAETALCLAVGDDDHTRITVAIARGLATTVC